MKCVILALKEGITVSRFLPLVDKLQEKWISVQAFLTDEELLKENGVLYITDCGKKALLLKEQKLPVLAFLHEKGTDFTGIDYVMECPEEIDVRYLERVFRRYHDIPWDIMETERCSIRESAVEDVDAFFEIYEHPDIVKYTEGLYPTKAQERAYIREYIDRVYKYYEFGVWTVLLKETGEIIGRAGFSVREGYDLPELGFVIGVEWQGKGIAYEICTSLLQYGKEEFEFDCVQLLVMPENTASLTLCKKLGFIEQGKVLEKGKEYLLMIKEL